MKATRKRLAFGAIFAVILVAATLAGIELMASFFVPSWPARAINPRGPAPARVMTAPFERQQWLGEADNSWGLRDRERAFEKQTGIYRAAFVGDSFVESRYTRRTLPAAVQDRVDPSEKRFEAFNLGISGTDPRSYFYRLRDVALHLRPDAVLLFVYAGNDFMQPDQGYSVWPRLIDESPGGSLLGQLMPRTNWLAVNRLDLSSFFRRGSAPPPDEAQRIFDAVTAPADQRVARLVRYVRTYIDPPIPDTQLTEILSRDGGRLLEIARPQDGEQEYLLDWMLRILMSWEATGTVGLSAEDVRQAASRGQVDATLSWIRAIRGLLAERQVPLLLFLIPTGAVDPDYRAFWSPWPRAYVWNRVCQEWQSQLMADLRQDKIEFTDLAEVLEGVPGTYRKLDGHWTEKGLAIVADRVGRALDARIAKRVAP